MTGKTTSQNRNEAGMLTELEAAKVAGELNDSELDRVIGGQNGGHGHSEYPIVYPQ
jgi:hypothetical protein